MSVFMKVPGIKGGCRLAGYKDWIRLKQLSWSGSARPPLFDGQGAGDGQCTTRDITVQKGADPASPLLYQALCTNQVFPLIEVHICALAEARREPYKILKIEQASPVSLELRVDDETGACVETMQLAFSKLSWTYIPMGEDGQRSSTHQIETTHDFERYQEP